MSLRAYDLNTQVPVETLIVDDSDVFRRILRARLEHIGCTIVGEARSAGEGLDLFHALKPRLVTIDLVMPKPEEMSVDRLFCIIRQESPVTAIVVISSHPKDPNAADFLVAGALAYVEKNFMSFDRLAVTLRTAFPEL
jgi:DNA-binding NarL/FixJ family response regulator